MKDDPNGQTINCQKCGQEHYDWLNDCPVCYGKEVGAKMMKLNPVAKIPKPISKPKFKRKEKNIGLLF